MDTQVNGNRLVVAGIGFFLTRFSVTLAVYDEPVRFYFAGVVMPVWLNLVGIGAPVPNLATTPLLTHLVWGVSIGVLVSLGYERVAPEQGR